MISLGISCFYHDSAICIMQDGKVMFAIQEERLSRKKHDSSFPILAINTGLSQLGLRIDDVDNIIFYEDPSLKFKRILSQVIDAWPFSWREFSQDLCYYLKYKYNLRKIIRHNLFYKGKIEFSEHHLSHALSTLYFAPFDKCLVFVLDGVGEEDSCSVYSASNNKLKKETSIKYPHSLGLLYSAFTQYLGFRINNGEYKVMGLAPYGEPRYLNLLLDHLVTVNNKKGTFKLNMKYFDFFSKKRAFTDKLVDLLGISPRQLGQKDLSQEHKDLAASVQRLLEILIVNLVGHWVDKTGIKDVCFSGGVALNCTANSHLIRQLGISSFIHPAAGDAGGALGAAIHGNKSLQLTHNEGFSPYLGKKFMDVEIEVCCKNYNLDYTQIDDVAKDIATAISNKKVVALFQGRDEWGPRALGNRSILASPIYDDMKDHLNAKIKFREKFRPFAPAVMEEYYEEFFEHLNMKNSPYMLYTHQTKKNNLPAVTHVNNTSRAQTVSEKQNSLFYNIIKEHYNITGVPVVVNTSFNLKGEPIVFSPSDAIKTFLSSDIDTLFLESYKIEK